MITTWLVKTFFCVPTPKENLTASYWLYGGCVPCRPSWLCRTFFLAITGLTESLGSALSSAHAEARFASKFMSVLSEVPGHTYTEASVFITISNGHTKHYFRTVLGGFSKGSSPQKGGKNFMDHCVRTNFIATEWKTLVTQHIKKKKKEHHDFGWKTLYLPC